MQRYPKNKGILVNVEGISGAGKTSLSKALKKELKNLHYDVLPLGGFEVYPYSSPITAFLRKLVNTRRFIGIPWTSEVHLLISELLYDIQILIKPALNCGKIVIYDGYWDALIAFQLARIQVQESGARSKAKAINYLKDILEIIFTFEEIPAPDCTIYIKCDIEKAAQRLKHRDHLPVTREHLALQAEIVRQYKRLFAKRNIFILDNNSDTNWQRNIKIATDYIIERTKIARREKWTKDYLSLLKV